MVYQKLWNLAFKGVRVPEKHGQFANHSRQSRQWSSVSICSGSGTEDTLTVLDQFIQLPGEISTLVLDHVLIACSSRGCAALSQLQRVICVDGAADSIVELLTLRLDEQGTDLSTPWPQEPGQSILDVMWPQVKEALLTKQEWKGCT
jgi:hypothetical protein